MEVDRKWGEQHPGFDELAFHDELPGIGHDIAYTGFRTFCLAVALELLRFGFKPGEVVELIALQIKQLRTAFESTTANIKTAGRSHFTQGEPKRVGQPYDHLMFYVVWQVEAHREIAERSGGVIKEGETLNLPDMFRGWDKLTPVLEQRIPSEASSVFVLEVSEIATRTEELLELAPPKKRGRQ